MRFRLGFILGAAAGYTFGAKAGQERYEEIQRAIASLKRSEPAQQFTAEVREAASKAGHVIEEKAAESVAKVTSRARGRDDGNPPTSSAGPTAAPPTSSAGPAAAPGYGSS